MMISDFPSSQRPMDVVSRWLPAVLQLMQAVPLSAAPRVLAIDGRAASGKSTLADELQRLGGAAVIHMDDFFLPSELRTAQRRDQPGGNVHYERFQEEVLPRLGSFDSFSYRKFDCQIMDFAAPRQVGAADWRIVEGCYSCHPELGAYMDLRVFCDIDPINQLERVRLRNGEKAAEMFRARWIPLEEAYFAAYDIQANADLVLTA